MDELAMEMIIRVLVVLEYDSIFRRGMNNVCLSSFFVDFFQKINMYMFTYVIDTSIWDLQ